MESNKRKELSLKLVCVFMIWVIAVGLFICGYCCGFSVRPCEYVEPVTRGYEISTDVLFSTEAAISELYVGENEERLQVYDIQVSEDGNSLIIYKIDSDPIIFKKGE